MIAKSKLKTDEAVLYTLSAVLVLCLPLTRRNAFEKVARLPLYCDYRGSRARVVAVTKSGNVKIEFVLNHKPHVKRVPLDECGNWGGRMELAL